MLTGAKLDAQRALDWGLINRVVPDDQLEETTLALARKLAEGPSVSLGIIRQLSWTAANGTFVDTLAAERDGQRRAGLTKDAMEGISAFMQKRAPSFTGA